MLQKTTYSIWPLSRLSPSNSRHFQFMHLDKENDRMRKQIHTLSESMPRHRNLAVYFPIAPLNNTSSLPCRKGTAVETKRIIGSQGLLESFEPIGNLRLFYGLSSCCLLSYKQIPVSEHAFYGNPKGVLLLGCLNGPLRACGTELCLF